MVLLCLIAAPIWFTIDQFIMSSKVAKISDEFELLVNAKQNGTISSYAGKIDSLVIERNKTVNKEGYIFLGKWSTYWISYGIYYDATWFSPRTFDLLKNILNERNSKNIFDLLIIIFIILLKPIIYSFLCIVFYWLRKPAQ